jgi:chromosome segregation ATPase
MDILALAQEQAVLRKKREEAHEELQVVSRQVEKASETLSIIEARIKGQTQVLNDKKEAIRSAEEEHQTILLATAHARQQKEEMTENLKKQEIDIQEQCALLEQRRHVIEKDIVTLQLAKEEVAKELGTLKDDNVEQGNIYTSLLIAIQEAKHNLDNTRNACEQERIRLSQEKRVLHDTSTMLKEKEAQLCTLRGDLQILHNRYASFAQKHNLPFTI